MQRPIRKNYSCAMVAKEHAARYKTLYKLYKQAAKLYATNGSRVVEEAVVEHDVVVPSAVAEKTANDKYRYHTARKGGDVLQEHTPIPAGLEKEEDCGGNA